MSGLTDLIALCLVAFCAAVVGRRAWRWLSALRDGVPAAGCGGCGNCASSSKAAQCHHDQERGAPGGRP